MFNEVARIVPPGISGNCEIQHQRVRRYHRTHIEYYGPMRVRPGIYASLLVDGATMMGETECEWVTSLPVMENARGHVLIAGLGIGMILPAILGNPAVTSVLVVEKSEHVIKLVLPYYEHPKLEVCNADINDWIKLVNPNRRRGLLDPLYDTIFLDIWPDVSVKNLPEMYALKQAMKSKVLAPGGWLGLWVEDYLVEQKAHGSGCCVEVRPGAFICKAKHEERDEDEWLNDLYDGPLLPDEVLA